MRVRKEAGSVAEVVRRVSRRAQRARGDGEERSKRMAPPSSVRSHHKASKGAGRGVK